jgi:hypothetical protein
MKFKSLLSERSDTVDALRVAKRDIELCLHKFMGENANLRAKTAKLAKS